MADDVYYSALHWAKKAEASAKEAAESAATPGKVIQLGFDGSIQNNQLVFKHAPGGVEVPYQLVDDVEYELDLAYNGDLDSLTTMVVKNGPDTIGFVSAQHRPSTEPARVADMDAVMRYDATTGYRWLFKATFKIAPNGAKVFLLYPVVAAKDYSDKTNCITEIPQDIKLEIESTTDKFPELILKAGSKVYVSTNGTFNPVIIQSDIKGGGELWTGDHRRELFVVYVPSANAILSLPVQYCFSQNTAPTSFLADLYAGWFDTSTNTVKYTTDGGSNWTICSLPVCLGRPGEDYVGWSGYLDQVFNGFGYIGSTVFALPNVKGLIPNGRNKDGSLNNIAMLVSNVITTTFSSSENQNDVDCVLQGTTIWARNQIVVKSASEIGASTGNYYIVDENRFVFSSSGALSNQSRAIIGKITVSSGRITSFTPKLPFRAVDQNDFNKEAVKTSGDQTISGVKTIDTGSSSCLQIKSNIIENSVTPETDQFSNFIDMLDKNNTRIGRIFQRKRANGDNGIFLQAWSGGTNYMLGVNSDGSTEAPTPPTTDNSTQIATTAWVNNKHQVVTALPSSPTAGVFYFIKE